MKRHLETILKRHLETIWAWILGAAVFLAPLIALANGVGKIP